MLKITRNRAKPQEADSEMEPAYNDAGSLIGFQYVSKDVPDDQPGQEPNKDPVKGITDNENISEEVLRELVPHIIPWG